MTTADTIAPEDDDHWRSVQPDDKHLRPLCLLRRTDSSRLGPLRVRARRRCPARPEPEGFRRPEPGQPQVPVVRPSMRQTDVDPTCRNFHVGGPRRDCAGLQRRAGVNVGSTFQAAARSPARGCGLRLQRRRAVKHPSQPAPCLKLPFLRPQRIARRSARDLRCRIRQPTALAAFGRNRPHVESATDLKESPNLEKLQRIPMRGRTTT